MDQLCLKGIARQGETTNAGAELCPSSVSAGHSVLVGANQPTISKIEDGKVNRQLLFPLGIDTAVTDGHSWVIPGATHEPPATNRDGDIQ